MEQTPGLRSWPIASLLHLSVPQGPPRPTLSCPNLTISLLSSQDPSKPKGYYGSIPEHTCFPLGWQEDQGLKAPASNLSPLP